MANGVTRRGNGQPNVLRGTIGDDTYFGEGGNDVLFGLAGEDKCNGGRGDDRIEGGSGDDTLIGGAGNDSVRGGDGDDTMEGGAGNDRMTAGNGDDTVRAGSGNDRVEAGNGNDNVDAGSGNDIVKGGRGDDLIKGGSGDDSLAGDDGNDTIDGDAGDDRMSGGKGNDTLIWLNGGGSDVMSGEEGIDTILVEGSPTGGDNFTLGKDASGKVLFSRPTIDGRAVGAFTLTIDTAEIIDVRGLDGNDTFTVNDLSATDVTSVLWSGGDGNDTLDARNTNIRVIANGGAGDDLMTGGTGTVQVGAAVQGDIFTGGAGRDRYQFATDPFAGGVAGLNVNRPDVVTDYEIGTDSLLFNRQSSGINALNFQSGNAAQLTGTSNVVVLTDPNGFANAGAAAAAIAANNNFTGGRGLFVYFNTTLGFSRVVLSEDLANGGRFSVQANLTNLTNIANQANFTAVDFALS